MNVTKQMVGVMTVIGVLSSLVLAASDTLTRERIARNKEQELQRSIFEVVPGAKTSAEVKRTPTLRVYKGLNDQQQMLGYAFVTEGSGFQGKIRMIVGINPKLDTLLGMKVLDQVETPGLGGDITSKTRKMSSGKTFQEQFTGLSMPSVTTGSSLTSGPINYIKNMAPQKPGEIEAITGATISSKAVVRILNQSLKELSGIMQP